MNDQESKSEHECKDVDVSSALQWLKSTWEETRDDRLLCMCSEDAAWTLVQYQAYMQNEADVALCKAMTTEGLERFDVLFDAIVAMCESGNHEGMNRLMDLALGTGNRGYVRTVLIAVKPVRSVVDKDKYDRLVEFLRKGNKDTKGRWIPVEEALPDVEDGVDPLGRAMSKKVLVMYELSDGVDYSVDQMYYQHGKTPRWFKLWDTVKAWMEISE